MFSFLVPTLFIGHRFFLVWVLQYFETQLIALSFWLPAKNCCCLVFLKFLFYFGGLLPLSLLSHCPRWRSLSISGSLSQAIGGWRRRLVADASAVSFYPCLSTLTNYHLHLLKAPACLYSLRSFGSVADEFIYFSCVRIADNNLSPPQSSTLLPVDFSLHTTLFYSLNWSENITDCPK